MSACKVCGNEAFAETLCGPCTSKLGLARGDGVRSRGPCAECGHPVGIRALDRELTVGPLVDGGRSHRVARATVAMGVTYDPSDQHTLWNDRVKGGDGVSRRRQLALGRDS